MNTNCIIIAEKALIGESLKIFENPMINVENGKISSISEYDKTIFPEKVTVYDYSNCTVLPGLFNLHVHIQRRNLASPDAGTFRSGAAQIENQPAPFKTILATKNALTELANGVTTIRDCSSGDHISLHLKKAIEAGIIKGPTVFSCGMGIASTGGHETHLYRGAVEADGPDEIRQAVREEIKLGADFIKLMASGGLGGFPDRESPQTVEMTVEELTAAISEAHARGKRVTAHAMGEKSISGCLAAGIDCIEHGVELTEELINRMVREKIAYVPTVSGITRVAERIRAAGKDEIADYLDKNVVERLRNSIRCAIKNGLLIGAGTDTLGSIHDELDIFCELGMDNRQALRSATYDAARICGLEKVCGALAPGLDADLLVVKNNPLEHLEELKNIIAVFAKGQRAEMDNSATTPG